AQNERLPDAVAAFQEDLEVSRPLAKTNPAAYDPQVASALNNLAIVHGDTGQRQQAEQELTEALQIRRRLAKTNPAVYQQRVAETLNNLALLYQNTERPREAEKAFQEESGIYRELAKADPDSFQPLVGTALNNLAQLHLRMENTALAQTEVQEALAINRELYKANPELAGDALAKSLLIDSFVLSDTHQPPSAVCAVMREAVTAAQSSHLKNTVTQISAKECTAP